MSRYSSIVSKLAQTPVNPQTGLQVMQAPGPLEENLSTPEPSGIPQEMPSETTSRETGLPENLQSGEPLKKQIGLPESLQAGVPESLQNNLLSEAVESPLPEPEPRLEKYSTYLESDLSVQLKLFAVSRRLKDYQVVNAALRAYLETNSR